MVVSHNINAINTYNQMNKTVCSTNESMEKLSSGYKINRAADDAAGLAISEKMRSQIRGLNQASENASQGISMIQTAEGALNETHSILQRMRELAVQSANDTNAQSDREALQNEVSQLISEINRIGNTTEFNGMKILNGDFGMKVEGTDFSKRIEGYEFINGINFFNQNSDYVNVRHGKELALWSGLESGEGKNTIKIYKDNDELKFDFTCHNGTFSKMAYDNISYTFDDHYLILGSYSYDEENDKLVPEIKRTNDINEYKDIEIEGLPITQIENEYTFNKFGLNFSLNKKMIDEKLLDEKIITIDLNNIGITKDYENFTNLEHVQYLTKNDIKELMDMSDEKSYVYFDLFNHNQKVAYSQIKDSEPTIPSLVVEEGTMTYDLYNNSLSLYQQPSIDINDGEVVISKSENTQDLKYEFIDYLDDNQLYLFMGMIKSGPVPSFKMNGEPYSMEAVGHLWPIDSRLYHLDCYDANYDFGIIKDEIENNEGVVFHIGANSNQSITCTFNDMRAKNLGLTGYGEGYSTKVDVTDGIARECKEFGVNISTRLSAEKAIDIIDKAIEKVSQERSRYGSIQNRLDYTINNLETTSENMSKAESVIRDTDMASEMMNETKNNILQQASQAILVQAMQNQQQVLNLLR